MCGVHASRRAGLVGNLCVGVFLSLHGELSRDKGSVSSLFTTWLKSLFSNRPHILPKSDNGRMLPTQGTRF